MLQYWCLSSALTLWVRALDASKSQRTCIILSIFFCKSKSEHLCYDWLNYPLQSSRGLWVTNWILLLRGSLDVKIRNMGLFQKFNRKFPLEKYGWFTWVFKKWGPWVTKFSHGFQWQKNVQLSQDEKLYKRGNQWHIKCNQISCTSAQITEHVIVKKKNTFHNFD